MSSLLLVSAKSDPKQVAKAIVATIANAENRKAVLQVIGAGSVNQAVKSVAVARSLVISSGRDLVCSPSFINVDTDGTGIEKTAIQMTVQSIEV